MKHEFKKSSSISHCDYREGSLFIKFHSGDKEHEFKECPKEIYDGLKAAESPGSFFHKNVRGKFAAGKSK